jgi:mRNA-degrading endonuclease YafQ of YafQ-DinJ toxin-antitoxin module
MKKATKKVKVDIEKFLDAIGLLYRIGKLNATQIDYSCVFEKDLTMAQKRKISKYMEIKNVLTSMILFPKEFGGVRRKDLEVTHYPKGTWGAKIVKPTPKKVSVKKRVNTK